MTASREHGQGERYDELMIRLCVLIGAAVVLASCAVTPLVSCGAAKGCADAAAAAEALFRRESAATPDRLAAYPVRAGGSHWQVVACFPGGAHRVVDVALLEGGTARAANGAGIVGVDPCA